jgi:hypothetical protein
MQSMKNRGRLPGRQRGVTFLGWVVLLTPMALVVYLAIRLAPVYLNYSKVSRVFSQVQAEYKTQESVTPQVLLTAVARRFNIESITKPEVNDVVVTKSAEGWLIEASYEDIVPVVYNASVLVQFENSVTIP